MNIHELGIVISLLIFFILYYNRIGISRSGANKFLNRIDSKWSSDGEYIYPPELFTLILLRLINYSSIIWLKIITISLMVVGSIIGYFHLNGSSVQHMSSNSFLIIMLICATVSSISVHLSITNNISTNKFPVLKLCNHDIDLHGLIRNKEYSFSKLNLYSYYVDTEKSRNMVDVILRLAGSHSYSSASDIDTMAETQLNNSISKLLTTYRSNVSSRDTKNESLLPLIDDVVDNYRYSIINGSIKNYMGALICLSIPTIFGVINIKTMILLVVGFVLVKAMESFKNRDMSHEFILYYIIMKEIIILLQLVATLIFIV